MRRRAHLASMVLLATTAMGASHAGCIDIPFPAGESEEKYIGSPTEPTRLECLPSQGDKWKADADCGVFVSATRGNDENQGTSEMPVKSLAKAIELSVAKVKPVYACAEEFEGPVEMPAGTTLLGGLNCEDGWKWIGEDTRTTLTAPPGEIPLTVTAASSAGKVRLEDLHVLANSVPQDDTAEPGTSSIAAVATFVSLLELRRCKLEAGNAAPGIDGEPHKTPDTKGADGNPGQDACSGGTVVGGDYQINSCGTPEEPDDSIGGAGGAGRAIGGDSGTPGTSETQMAGTNAGSGAVGTTPCTSGTKGGDGGPGNPGNGAKGNGSITAEGYLGVSGGPGTPGTTAQGGGGGGGSRGVPTTSTSPARSCPGGTPPLGGASGGSGGAGGCGGAGGRGGGPGGASIALISINSGLSFDDVTIKTGNGGKGGDGGPGQDGEAGGMGGPGGKVPDGSSNLLEGCSGGTGGTGGKGGTGGGGRGGHSIGIAFQGATTPALGRVTFELGSAGNGGAGSDAGHDGAKGEKADTLPF